MMAPSYRLKLLGGLGFEGPGSLSGRVTQRRQLALLALLAGHESRLSRDKLIGFLWPETSPGRARHQLSDVVYVIRKGMGEDAILATGDTVQINPATVGSDLADFRSALAKGSYEHAVASYGGPFLDGFFPDESEPFERWMADERESLERQAARAAWAVVDRAETAGEIHEAIRWARRALKIVPANEQGVRRLIRLQEAHGDRAGAVQTYDQFAARLEAELDVRPSAETQALIAEIREGYDPDSASEPQGPPEAPGKAVPVPAAAEPAGQSTEIAGQPAATVGRVDSPRGLPWGNRWSRGLGVAAALAIVISAGWLISTRSEGGGSIVAADAPASVAVLPFEVRGEGLEVWREGMVDVLSANLDVFSELRAVPSRTVLARWREAGGSGPADLASALQVARRTEASYAVLGSIVGTEKRLRIHGELFDGRTGAKVGEATAEGSPDSVFALVDRLSVALVEPLLSSRSEDRRWPRLAATTTSSPTALKAFLEGEALLRTGQYQPAIEAFKRAIDADSTFALAHYRLAEAFGWTTSGVDSREHVRIAARYADRLPEREARLLRARKLGAEGRLPEGVATLREAVRQHPDDPEAWYSLGEVYYHVGNELLVPPWEFVDAFERSIELDPTFMPASEHLVDARFQRAPDSARVRAQIDRNIVGDDFDEDAFRLAFSGPHTSPQIRALLRDRNVLGMAIHPFAHPRFLNLREALLRTALERPVPNRERRTKAWLFWTLVARGQLEAAIELSEDPVLEGDRATMLYEAKTFGYPIPEETLTRALADAPTRPDDGGDGWTSGTPSIFERGAYAAEHGDLRGHATAKNELRKLIPMIETENATDMLRMRGLIEALDGYAAWRRGDDDRALALLRNAQVRTIGGQHLFRSITSERNQIIRAWLGELLLEMGRPREALVYYESLGPGWPISQDPMIYFHLGRIRDQLGDREGALHDYELAALAWQNPDPALLPLAETARREAARLRGLGRE